MRNVMILCMVVITGCDVKAPCSFTLNKKILYDEKVFKMRF